MGPRDGQLTTTHLQLPPTYQAATSVIWGEEITSDGPLDDAQRGISIVENVVSMALEADDSKLCG